MREHLMTSPARHIQKALNEELAPLRNLDITLGDKLQPIMERFREQLAESSKLLATQVAPLGLAAASLQTSTATLTGSMDRVAAAADRLPLALEHVESLQQKTAVMVQKMEGAGLIERRSDPDDQRFHRLYMTPAGKQKLREIDE